VLLEVSAIGSPAALVEELGQGKLAGLGRMNLISCHWFVPPNPTKALFGHVLLIAGSLGKSGALFSRAGARYGPAQVWSR